MQKQNDWNTLLFDNKKNTLAAAALLRLRISAYGIIFCNKKVRAWRDI